MSRKERFPSVTKSWLVVRLDTHVTVATAVDVAVELLSNCRVIWHRPSVEVGCLICVEQSWVDGSLNCSDRAVQTQAPRWKSSRNVSLLLEYLSTLPGVAPEMLE